MSTSVVELDKTFSPEVEESYGRITVRVVVLKKKAKDEANAAEQPADTLAEPDEDGTSEEPGDSPIDSYLERKKRGRQCVVFIINGQRHDALDSNFIGRDLGLKHLRNRTVVVVDLDGLTLAAIDDIVQGSRQGLYKGDVFHAICRRVISTLKGDPDLKRLQAEAEQEISDLKGGEEAVKSKLDELIDSHNVFGDHFAEGDGAVPDLPGTQGTVSQGTGRPTPQDVVTKAPPAVGTAATGPVLVAEPARRVLSLRPDTPSTLTIRAEPEGQWRNLERLDIQSSPEIEELSYVLTRQDAQSQATLRLEFAEPDDFDQDEYPLTTTLKVTARFRGHAEPRQLVQEVSINRPRGGGGGTKKPPPPLLAQPTFLRVVSRQPVTLVPDGPATHVKLRWNGLDSLASGGSPAWTFQARCVTLTNFPRFTFSRPTNGRFELLVDTPHGLLGGNELEFEVTATGPAGAVLTAHFRGRVQAHEEPRKVSSEAPGAAQRRKPPYKLKVVSEAEWGTTPCWGDKEWTAEDVGCYEEPTDSEPLTLIINEDHRLLKGFREDSARRLDEATVRRRVNEFQAHVYFHLYQQYKAILAVRRQAEQGLDVREPGEEEFQQEINRVGTTLLRLMA